MPSVHAFLGTATLVAAVVLLVVAALSFVSVRRGGRGLPTLVSIVAGIAGVLAVAALMLGPILLAGGYQVGSPLHLILGVVAVVIVPAAAAPGLLIEVRSDGDALRRHASLDRWLTVAGFALAVVAILLRVTG
jgi:hypothetical protein